VKSLTVDIACDKSSLIVTHLDIVTEGGTVLANIDDALATDQGGKYVAKLTGAHFELIGNNDKKLERTERIFIRETYKLVEGTTSDQISTYGVVYGDGVRTCAPEPPINVNTIASIAQPSLYPRHREY
jgi:hypothetical protein